MKDLIFLTWLYFQILLVQCDIFVNNLNGSNAPVKMCIKKTINHLFSENDTLNLILNNNNLCEDAIFEMSTMRQYIVISAINHVDKLQYDGKFIICTNDFHSLYGIVNSTYRIARRSNRTMGNSNILLITNMTEASRMCRLFLFRWLHNMIILVYGQGTSKLFTCNRFAPENECGKAAKVIHQDCEEQLSLSFTSVIHQMSKCPLIFYNNPDITSKNENHPVNRALKYVVKELSHRLNATFQYSVINDWGEYDSLLKNREMIVILTKTDSHIGGDDVTEPLVRADVLWLVPKARQISNMNVCLKVFNYDVWIATSVVFICVWLMWFLIISRNGGFTFDKLCISFLNVWSLTIFGNVTQLPRSTSLALRIILSFYLFYAINMQFAFTSDMSTVLTTPQYDFQIRNLEELADSQLPVYGVRDFKKYYFSVNMTDRKLYTKLQNLIHDVDTVQHARYMLDLHLHGNCAVTARLQDIRNTENGFNTKIEAYKIMDNSITPAHKLRLSLLIDHYFTTTLNIFVNRLIESGIYEKRKNDFYREAFGEENVDTTPQDDLITLKHLIFIFIFFGFGLCTACVVFCFELVFHKCL